jgi:hypothetical protein
VLPWGLTLLCAMLAASCQSPPSTTPSPSTAQPAGQPPADPLASWNDTATKKAIVVFVDRVTKKGSPDFVDVPERVATFDNDGTLWSEQPVYFQVALALDRIGGGDQVVVLR